MAATMPAMPIAKRKWPPLRAESARVRFIATLLFSFGLAGAVFAQMNLLPQGDFKNPGANTDYSQGFNIPQNQEFQVVTENGNSHLRIENHDSDRQLDYVHAFVDVTPQMESLSISVRMKATNLKVGKESWHNAAVALLFEGGSFGYPSEVPRLTADSDWVTQTVELPVPKGATRLNIQPAMFHATGVFEVADLTVTPHLTVVASTNIADAVLPAGTSLNWDKTDVTTVNAKRAQMPLSGIWHFIPAVEGSSEPPKVGWAYIKVPGSWGSGQGGQGRRGGGGGGGRLSAFVAVGGGPQWQMFDGSRVAHAWYERQISIPANWQGRAISLRFDRISTDAIIFVNGKECGRVAWPWGTVDITSAVTPGQTADVRILVAAIADSQEEGHFWQNAFMNVSYTAASLRSRGITGSVFLEGRASEGHVTDVFVRPSTRKQNISLDVDLASVKEAGNVHFVADMLNEKGEVEKTFTTDVPVAAKDTQTLTLSWPWADPRLWDVGKPNLYTLRLSATGSGLDDQYSQKFGFREFWIEGREFYLNGNVVRLRQPCFYNGPHMDPAVGDTFFWKWGPIASTPAGTLPTPVGNSTTRIERVTWWRSTF